MHFKLDPYPVITFMTKNPQRGRAERADFTGLMRLTTARSTGGYANGTKH